MLIANGFRTSRIRDQFLQFLLNKEASWRVSQSLNDYSQFFHRALKDLEVRLSLPVLAKLVNARNFVQTGHEEIVRDNPDPIHGLYDKGKGTLCNC